MRKLMISFVMAMAVGALSGVAQAADSAPECASLGAVAGNGGYWVYQPGTTTIVYGTEVTFSGNSGNGFVSATEVTTPGTCVGYNKADNPKGDEWVFEVGIATETPLDPVKVCQNVRGGGSTQTPESEPLGSFDCNP